VKKSRKHYTGEEKVATLRRHWLEQEREERGTDEIVTAGPDFFAPSPQPLAPHLTGSLALEC
jgi:hypothetical protein